MLILGTSNVMEPSDFLARYVSRFKGEAEIVRDWDLCLKRLSTSSGTPEKFDVVVVGTRFLATDERIRIRDAMLATSTLDSLRIVFLNFEYQSLPFVQDVRSLIIPATPISRDTFIKAIAIVCGRASPDTQSLAEQKNRPKLVAPSVEEAAAAGRLILIAEDNETNRDVLRRQITRLGYAAILVEDGRQALEAIRARNFGLLLTDCHMPVMDGYQLTEAIRAEEKGTDRHLPIVAITANALHGEAERCLKIGMDDFVVKPIELQAFRAKLAKWLPTSRAGDAPPRPPASFPGAEFVTGPAFDRSALEALVGDDVAMVNSILQDFATPSRRIVEEIATAYATRTAEPIGFGAHKLKSSARTIGAKALADMCVDLETAAKAEDWVAIDAIAPILNDALGEVLASIRSELERFGHD